VDPVSVQFPSCSRGPVIPRTKYSQNFTPIRTLINKEVSHKLQIRKVWRLQWLASSSTRPDSSFANFGFSSTCLPVLSCFRYGLHIFAHGDARTLRTFSLCYSLPTDRSKTLLLCWCSDGFPVQLVSYVNTKEVQIFFTKHDLNLQRHQ